MVFLVKIFYSIIIMIIGGLILKYRKVIKGWTGNFIWAERYIGSGGTYFIIILFGMGLIFFGTLYPFGGLKVLFQ